MRDIPQLDLKDLMNLNVQNLLQVLAQSDVNPDDFELLCPSEEQNVVRDSATGSDESFGGGYGSYYSRRRNYGAVLTRRPISE